MLRSYQTNLFGQQYSCLPFMLDTQYTEVGARRLDNGNGPLLQLAIALCADGKCVSLRYCFH